MISHYSVGHILAISIVCTHLPDQVDSLQLLTEVQMTSVFVVAWVWQASCISKNRSSNENLVHIYASCTQSWTCVAASTTGKSFRYSMTSVGPAGEQPLPCQYMQQRQLPAEWRQRWGRRCLWRSWTFCSAAHWSRAPCPCLCPHACLAVA